jgi:dipeptidyl aminopeptidase/acylaminoacyl peptidase
MNRVSPLFTVGPAGAGRTPGTVLVTDNDGALDTWEEYALTPGAKATPLFAGVQVQELLHDPTSDLLIGGVLSGGQTAQFFDPRLQHRFDAARKAFANYQIALASFSTDLKRMVIKTDGADDSGTYWLIDMTTGKAEDLMGAYPAIEAKDVGPTRMFAYKAADGLALEGVLTLPPGSDGQALPLVVMPHGGPFDVNDVVGFDWWAQAFAGRGYAVFQPNYRGSSGYGLAFRDKGYGEWGRGMLSDMSDGVAALAKAGIIDPRRACIVGASYGGYAALAGVTIQHGLYRCAVSVSGVSDVGAVMNQMNFNDETAAGRYTQRFFGAKTPFDRAITDISPVRHAGAAEAPILMIHGQDDTRVPLVHSLAMRDALQKAHKTVELVITPGEDHFLSREATRVQTLEASVGWVEKYNPAGK